MDHAQESGLWKAVGGCEADIAGLDERLDRVEAVHSLRRRPAWVDAVWLGLGLVMCWHVLGVMGAVRERVANDGAVACTQDAGHLAVKRPANGNRQDL